MGTWGTGIKDCDEFYDCYEEFFQAFKDGKNPAELAEEIWKEHSSRFPEDIPLDSDTDILHTVRFALAQCLWECGVTEHFILSDVEQIIKNDLNIKFFDESNGGDTKLANERRRKLNKFLNKLHTPPSKIRTAPKSRKPRTPSFHKGDIFAYNTNEGYRAAVILDCVEKDYLISVSDQIFSDIPTKKMVLNSTTGLVFWIYEKYVLPKRERIFIETVNITQNYNGYAGLLRNKSIFKNSNIGYREFFYGDDFAIDTMRRNKIGTYQINDILTSNPLPKTIIKKI